MHRTSAIALVLVSVAVGSIGRGVAANAQSPQRAAVVKYAYVIGMNDKAFICFAESAGCRMEPVTTEPVMATFAGRTAVDVSATQGAAFAKAVAQLGEAGWEMIGPGPAYANVTTEQALHFKLSPR